VFNDFFLNILIIGTFLLLTGYIFRRNPSDLGVSIKIRIIAGLGTGHLGILLMSYPIHLGQNVIDLSNLTIYMIVTYAGPVPAILTTIVIILYRLFILGFTPVFLVLAIISLTIGIFDIFIIKMKVTSLKKSIYINVFNTTFSTIVLYIFMKPMGFSNNPASTLIFFVLFSFAGAFIIYSIFPFIKKGNITYREMEYYRIMTENLSDIISTFNYQWKYLYISPSSKRVLGYDSKEIVGRSIKYFIHAEDIDLVNSFKERLSNASGMATIRYRFMKKDGSYIWVESTLRSMKRGNGNIVEWIAASRDITEQKEIEGKLKDMSYIDGLTEIHNRRYFDEIIVREWDKAIINSEPISLLILDIDYFKNYNDTYGHLKGDECLKFVASSINNLILRGSDFVARYGGEEFVIISNNTNESGALVIAERVRRNVEALKIENINSEVKTTLTISIGVATILPNTTINFKKLIANADEALYKAKKNGRNRCEVFKLGSNPSSEKKD